jgi:hypothetical protein
MPITERELGDVIDDLLTDFPDADRDVLDRVVHACAARAPGGTPGQVEKAARMKLHLRHQGDH